MSEKVKLTQKQADAFDKMFELGVLNKWKVIKLHVKEPEAWQDHCTPLNGMELDILIRAIYIGYEVEQTPEDKVREYFKEQTKLHYDREGNEDYVLYAIQKVLDLLNIKIKGVNYLE